MNKGILALIMAAVMLLTAACGAAAPAPGTNNAGGLAPIAKEDIKAGFVYIGPVGDEGYSYAHDLGRRALEDMGIETKFVENIPENSDCEKAVRDLIDLGCNVIFTTSFGHMDWTLNVAEDFPEVYFCHATGYKTAENMSTYFGRMYEARYLSGIAAGLKTQTNKIGYVAAMPISEVVRGANAFALGVKSVNPDATVEVLWTNTWYDPALEKQTALELLNKGCDVLGQHCDTTAPIIAAQEKGAFAVGYNAAKPDAGPDAYLTAALWDWSKYYVDTIEQIAAGTWKGEKIWMPASTGICYLDELSANNAEGAQQAIDEAKALFAQDSLFPFTGPMKDNTGKEMVAAGTQMTDDELWNMMWFVDNIIGTVPSQN